MPMNPYLSGRVCRMTKHSPTDELMDHNLVISDHLAALCSVLTIKMLTTAPLRSYEAALYSVVRHCPQFMGAFHSFVLKCCFIFSSMCTGCSCETADL